MTEIEFFIQLLDENAIDELLKAFGLYIKSQNINLKKIQLRKTLKGLYNGVKKKKIPISEFDFAIKQYIIKDFSKYSGEELFELFSKDGKLDIPNYKKFANALYYHEELTKANLEKMEYNYDKNKNIFKDIFKITSSDELENLLIKSMNYNISIKSIVIKQISEKLDKKLKDSLEELEEEIKKWTLVDYYYKYMEKSQDHPIYLIQLQYLILHENKPEIENRIAIEMLNNFYSYKTKEKYSSITSAENSSMIKLKRENKKLNNEYNNILKTNKQLTKKVIIAEKDANIIEKKVFDYENTIEKLNFNINKLLNETKEKNQILNSIKIENKKMLLLLKEAELEKDNLLSENIKLNNSIFKIKNYIENVMATTEKNEKSKFAIICSIETEICKILYPEVVFINAKEWEKDNIALEKLNSNIKKIYIQRLGLSSTNISSIEKFAKINKIQTQIIVPKNEKDMIEFIVNIKNNL